jgi:hypothetical protein
MYNFFSLSQRFTTYIPCIDDAYESRLWCRWWIGYIYILCDGILLPPVHHFSPYARIIMSYRESIFERDIVILYRYDIWIGTIGTFYLHEGCASRCPSAPVSSSVSATVLHFFLATTQKPPTHTGHFLLEVIIFSIRYVPFRLNYCYLPQIKIIITCIGLQ